MPQSKRPQRSDAYLNALVKKHRELDRAIWEEMKRAQPNELLLKSLKRQKLAIKDDVTSLRGILKRASGATTSSPISL